ncbi:hypothetical protein [Cohnella fermenti]|uniref:Uncharacterized protein n=1 Tax=Cohnella fermenti TaxID=2565925 RepID=A0A4S4BN49_9BACL|nr:hypothetical protein [Cohnella fermenti]THF73919.1 hypothetical protein E6C55_26990 [Cohnella fermenti]
MKTREISADEFSSRFGVERAAGDFAYFVCDNGIGMIRDNRTRTMEVIVLPEAKPEALSEEDEIALMSAICGEYEQDCLWNDGLPKSDRLQDYEEREQAAGRRLNGIRAMLGGAIAVCFALIAWFCLQDWT